MIDDLVVDLKAEQGVDDDKKSYCLAELDKAEDNMNSQMASVTVTYRDGRVAQLENIYIRGSKIRFLILPDMLKNAPMFKNMMTRGRGGAPRGKSGILRAQAGAGGRGRGRGMSSD